MRTFDKSETTRALIAIGIFIFASVIVMLYGGFSAGDDTFIYLRYVQNALTGHGFTFNPGETSYGCTSTLWAFLMKPIAYFAGNNVWTWKIASSILFGLRASFLYLLLSRFRVGFGWTLTLTLAAIVEPHTFRWASSGMENSLAVLLLTVAAYLFFLCAEKASVIKLILLGLVCALLPFTRPELALISLAVSIFVPLIILNYRFLAAFFATEVVVFGLCLALVWFCFGALIPQSAEAKALFLQFPTRYYALLQCAKIVLTGGISLLIVLVLVNGISKGAKCWRLAALFCFIVSILYLSYRNHLVSTRYASYICAPVVLAAIIVIAEKVAAGTPRTYCFKAAIILHLLISAGVLVYLWPTTRAGDYHDIRKVAEALSSRTDENSRIAVSEVGAFGFYSDRYIIDLDGLTDRATLSWAKQNGPGLGMAGLENLLIARGATHFIDTRSEQNQTLIRGKRLNFTVILEMNVTRDILQSGKPTETRWRVYELTPK